MSNPIPKVAAIHDLSGFGRSSLTVVIPILSAMGIQVCPLPTAVLSTHCGYKGFKMADLTDKMREFIEHWKTLNIHFDAIYSGFLGSPEQIEIVKDFIHSFKQKKQLVVVDPVMADDGQLYSVYDKKMVNEMISLVGYSDVITPNLTEAAFLLGEKYNPEISEEETKKWLKRLTKLGPKTAIITSVPVHDTKTKMTSVVALSTHDNRYWKVSCEYMPAVFPGAGDAFASVVTGSLLKGDSLPIALDHAVQFISLGIKATFGYNYDTNEGFLQEKALTGLMNNTIQMSTYELLS